MELAGGDEGLMELFGSRLRTVLTPHGFDVGWGWAMVAAFKIQAENPRPYFTLVHYRPLPWETEIDCLWEGFDLARDVTPFHASTLPPSDPFVMLYTSVRDLIAEWPEVIVRRK